MASKYELKQSTDGQFAWELKTSSGEVILTSEMYEAKDAATEAIALVRVNALLDKRYERRIATNGSPYFVLETGNGQRIGKSALYSGAVAMQVGITSIKHNAQTP